MRCPPRPADHGVDPVLDHDHGSAPGIIEHSDKTPTLPPVIPSAAPGGPHHGPKMKCSALQPQISKEWCEVTCTPEQCDTTICRCHKAGEAELRRDTKRPEQETTEFKMTCRGLQPQISQDWCEVTCGANPAGCDAKLCKCKQSPVHSPA